MKIKRQPGLGGVPLARTPSGTFQYIRNDKLFIQSKPKQPYKNDLNAQFNRAQMQAAAAMIGLALPLELDIAHSWSKNSQDTWKDTLMRAQFGTLFYVTLPGGIEYHPADHSYPGPPEPEEGEIPWTLLLTWDGATDPAAQNIDFALTAPFTEYLILASQVRTTASSGRGVKVSTDGGVSYHGGTNYVQYLASSGPSADDRFVWPGVNGATPTGMIMWIIGATIGQGCCWALFHTAGQYGTQFIGSTDPVTNLRIHSQHSVWDGGKFYILGK